MSADLLTRLLGGAALASFALAIVLTPLARRVALAIGFLDHPGGHKSHVGAMPYGGGAAIFLATWLPVALAVLAAALLPDDWVAGWLGDAQVLHLLGGAREKAGQALVILGGALVIFALGLCDDGRPLGPILKLLVILAVAISVTTFGGVRMAEFAGRLPSIALSCVWIFVITNSLNFLDNMDGLSAGIAAIGAAFLSVCGVLAGQVLVPMFGSLLAGALFGFLIFNFPPAKIFMGDAGSLLNGYMLSVLSILTSYWASGSEPVPYALAMPLCVLAVPLYDFVSVVVLRVLEGRNPLKGDQRHFSHRLVQRGLSRRGAVLTIYLATATTGLAATLLPGAGLIRTLALIAIVLMVLTIVAILEAPLRREP